MKINRNIAKSIFTLILAALFLGMHSVDTDRPTVYSIKNMINHTIAITQKNEEKPDNPGKHYMRNGYGIILGCYLFSVDHLAGGKYIHNTTYEGKKPKRLVYANPDDDMIVFQIDDEDCNNIKIDPYLEVNWGDKVIWIRKFMTEPTPIEGVRIGEAIYNGTKTVTYIISTPSRPGTSGSPVFNDNNQLIGIIAGTFILGHNRYHAHVIPISVYYKGLKANNVRM